MPTEDTKPTDAKSEETKTREGTPPPAYPLFYKEPVVLRKEDHSTLRLVAAQNYAFAKDTNAVLILGSEFTQAARYYPIVFVGEQPMPVTVLGLAKENLFVDKDGQWDTARTYKPAYIQRYPFLAVSMPGVADPSLGVDLACERLVTSGKAHKSALPLFAEGQAAKLTQDAARFCSGWNSDYVATVAFCQALNAHDLLADQQLAAVVPGGKRYATTGFKIVDIRKLHALPQDVLMEWHRNGFLALVYAHLASQLCWNDLAVKMGLLDGTAPAGGA